MSSLIDIKTLTNRMLFDLNDVTTMVYSKNTLTIHHINEPASTYRMDNLSQKQFDNILEETGNILGYKPIAVEASGNIQVYLVSHIKNITIEYSKRANMPSSITITYPNTHNTILVGGDIDAFYDTLWSDMNFVKSHAMTR